MPTNIIEAFRRRYPANTVPQQGPDGPEDAPKILHVGNVANLAFVNARLLNERGFNNHLLTPDFYHFASSPEWQDMLDKPVDRSLLGDDWYANFSGRGVPNVPKYKWIAQGPTHLAIAYLYLLNTGSPHAELARACLEFQRMKATFLKTGLPQSSLLTDVDVKEMFSRSNLSRVEKARIRSGRVADDLLADVRRVVGRLYGEPTAATVTSPFHPTIVDSYANADPELQKLWEPVKAAGSAPATGIVMPEALLSHECGIPDGVREEDAQPYMYTVSWWKELFRQYDHVVLYGSSAIYGLLSGEKYFAYEHGNIRKIPFEDTPLGRLTREAYDRAEGVFITNTDYIRARPRLEFPVEKRHYIPHAFEERIIFDFKRQCQEEIAKNPRAKAHKSRPAGTVEFFSPSRQDWKIEDPSLNKGNDRVIRAIAQIRDKGITNFHITFVEWGRDSVATKELIEELGVGGFVSWVDPLPKGELWKAYLRSNAVIDQFFLDAFGGVTYETLALGRRVITRDDGIANMAFFNQDPPPLLSAETADDIAARMEQVIADPHDEAGIGDAALIWIIRRHSSDAIRNIMWDAFNDQGHHAAARARAEDEQREAEAKAAAPAPEVKAKPKAKSAKPKPAAAAKSSAKKPATKRTAAKKTAGGTAKKSSSDKKSSPAKKPATTKKTAAKAKAKTPVRKKAPARAKNMAKSAIESKAVPSKPARAKTPSRKKAPAKRKISADGNGQGG